MPGPYKVQLPAGQIVSQEFGKRYRTLDEAHRLAKKVVFGSSEAVVIIDESSPNEFLTVVNSGSEWRHQLQTKSVRSDIQ